MQKDIPSWFPLCSRRIDPEIWRKSKKRDVLRKCFVDDRLRANSIQQTEIRM